MTSTALHPSLRGAVGVGLPLVLASVTGHESAGMLAGLGALWGVSQDGFDPLNTRRPRMLAIAATSGLGFFAGALVLRGAGTGWPVWLLLGLTALVAGAFEVGSSTAAAASMHLLLGAVVASGLPMPGPWWGAGVAVTAGALWMVALVLISEVRTDPPPDRLDESPTRAEVADRARFAVLLASAVVGGSILAWALHGPRAYWLPLAVAFIFRPTSGPVLRRAVARTAGTAVGAVIALAMSLTLHNLYAAAVFAAVCAAVMPLAARRSYGLSVAAFTPIVFVFLDLVGNDHGLFATRVLDTAIAGALVLVADLLRRLTVRPSVSTPLSQHRVRCLTQLTPTHSPIPDR